MQNALLGQFAVACPVSNPSYIHELVTKYNLQDKLMLYDDENKYFNKFFF